MLYQLHACYRKTNCDPPTGKPGQDSHRKKHPYNPCMQISTFTCIDPSSHPNCSTVGKYFPACQVRVVRFYVSCLPPPSPPPRPPPPLRPPPPPPRPHVSVPRRTSTTSVGWRRSPLDCQLFRLAVVSAGPQPRAPAGSVPCGASTANSAWQCSPPDLKRQLFVDYYVFSVTVLLG